MVFHLKQVLLALRKLRINLETVRTIGERATVIITERPILKEIVLHLEDLRLH